MAWVNGKKVLEEIQQLKKAEPKLKKKRLDKIKDLEKRLYYYKVWYITESQPLHKLRNYKKRCFKGRGCYHLDHKCSIAEGFMRKIPAEIIGDISNLRFITAKKNIEKGYKVTRTVLQETLKKKRKFRKI